MEKTFAHSVFFWLKPHLSAEDRTAFEKGVSTLVNTAGLKFSHIGTPAATSRDVIDHSYNYNLLLVFENTAAHDAYQTTDAVHQQFIATCKQYWEKIIVYDVLNLSGDVAQT